MIVLFKPTEKYLDYLSKKILQEMTKDMSIKRNCLHQLHTA